MLSERNCDTDPMEPSSFDIDAVKAQTRVKVATLYGLDKSAYEAVGPLESALGRAGRAASKAYQNDSGHILQKLLAGTGAGWKGFRRGKGFSAAGNALFSEHVIHPSQPGVLNKLKAFGKHVGEFGREMVAGSPITLAKQLKDHHIEAGGGVGGAVRAGGKYVKDFYMSPKSPMWMKALSLGVPAMELGGIALKGDPATRKGDLAHAISGLVASPFTARLGLPGMALQGAVQSGARALASKFDHKKQPYDPNYAQLGPHARNVVRATGGPLNALNDIVPPDIDAAT